MATLPRKNPRAGSDEKDLDDERRRNTSVVNRSIDPSRRETIEKKIVACVENNEAEATRIQAVIYITLASRVFGSEIRAFKMTTFKTIYGKMGTRRGKKRCQNDYLNSTI